MIEKNWTDFPIAYFFRGWYLNPCDEQERQARRTFIFNIAKKLDISYVFADETEDVKNRITQFFQNNAEIIIPAHEEPITEEEAMMIYKIWDICFKYRLEHHYIFQKHVH